MLDLVRERRRQLEVDLRLLLADFEAETGAVVDRIDLDHIDVSSPDDRKAKALLGEVQVRLTI